MIDATIIKSIQSHFNVHPLIFKRSLDKSSTPGELFDILDTLPEYPIIWDDEKQRWVTSDLLQSKGYSSRICSF